MCHPGPKNESAVTFSECTKFAVLFCLPHTMLHLGLSEFDSEFVPF